MQRIHIVGASPRSGTTLIAEAMIACFDIDLFCEHEERIYRAPATQGRVFLTKAPRDILLAEEELARNPDLNVIFMLRDPRNIIVSKHQRAPEQYWAGLKFWKLYTPIAKRLATHPRFITVRYEDLLARPDEIQGMLARKLPFLSKRANFSDYHLVAKPSTPAQTALSGVRPIAPPNREPWHAHLPRLAGQLAQHGSIVDDLIEFGYEKDDAWLASLVNVTADLRPGFWPEFFTAAQLARLKARD